MLAMVAQEMEPQVVDRSLIGRLELAGKDVPYVDLIDWPFLGTKLVADSTEYTYTRSFPIFGHSAVMPEAVDALKAQGKSILIVERPERYYVYTA
jgi:hypothetical protein